AVGNVGRLLRLVERGIPLPFGAVANARSFIAVDNLVDLIDVCASHPAAAGETFLASDGVAVSTPQFVRGIAAALGKRARLVPVPAMLLRGMATAVGKKDEIARLVGSLEIDMAHTCETLGWRPPVDLDEGLRRMVRR